MEEFLFEHVSKHSAFSPRYRGPCQRISYQENKLKYVFILYNMCLLKKINGLKKQAEKLLIKFDVSAFFEKHCNLYALLFFYEAPKHMHEYDLLIY